MKNKIAVVTGGASGIGLGIAKALHEKGAMVVVFDVNKESLQQVQDMFDTMFVDVTSEQQVQDAVNRVVEKHASIDILVNNAGIIHSEPLINIINPRQMKHRYESFKRVLDINLHSVFLMTSTVAEQMVLKRTKGSIINISSISANGNAGQTAYSAAKAAVNAMTKTWAKELGPFGIRTNAIAPGFIDTPSTSKAMNEKMLTQVIANTPLKRLGIVENIAQAAVFLIENEFMNGAVVDVNGGLVI